MAFQKRAGGRNSHPSFFPPTINHLILFDYLSKKAEYKRLAATLHTPDVELMATLKPRRESGHFKNYFLLMCIICTYKWSLM
jgi:hypothetical protein